MLGSQGKQKGCDPLGVELLSRLLKALTWVNLKSRIELRSVTYGPNNAKSFLMGTNLP